jgi:hypothetical protein
VGPWSEIFDTQNTDSLVDNTLLGNNDADNDETMSFQELATHGQESAQIWKSLMFSSGGALELYTKVFLASYELAVD